jgi:hypothetical protein
MRPSLYGLVTVGLVSADNLVQVSPLLENIRTAMSSPRGGRPVCLVCGRRVSAADESLKLRGGAIVHRRCATYDTHKRRATDRLD